MRHCINAVILGTGLLLSAPAYAADEVLLDEITIRVIENEDTPIDVNDIILPPGRGKSGDQRQAPSEDADERAPAGAGKAADKAWDKSAEKAAEGASRAAENAAAARERASEAADKGKGKGKGHNK